MKLVTPGLEHVASFRAALDRGWLEQERSPGEAARVREQVAADPAAFLASLDAREVDGMTYTLPDGSKVPRLPGYTRWIWDGEFCGAISFRWQPGTHALPPYCLGHIGYGVVAWKRRLGYATRALQLQLPAAHAEGLEYVEITTDADNVPSRRVIEVNGGILVERFVKSAAFDSAPGLRYRVPLIA